MDRPLTRELTRRLSGPYSYFCKGSVVEVTSNLEGYVGSWYEAKVFAVHKLPKSKFKSRREMHVEYTHLLSDKSMLPLKERVDVVLVRPLPPRIVSSEDRVEAEGDFEVGDEVDTLDRDGWWSGVVDRVIRRVEEGKEEVRYIVRFDDPVHEIEFRRDELRLHLDWMNGKWFVCRNGRSQELSVTLDGCVTLASVRNILKDLKHPINHGRQVVMGFCGNRCPRMMTSTGRLSPSNKNLSPCLSTSFHEEMIDLDYPWSSYTPAKKIKRTSKDCPSVPACGISNGSASEPCNAAPRLLHDGVNPSRDCQNKVAGSYITGAFNHKHITSSHAKRVKRKRSKHWRTILARGKAKMAAGVNDRPFMEEELFIGTKLTHGGKQGEVQNAKDVHSCTSMEQWSPVAVATDLTYNVQGHNNPSPAEQAHVAIGTKFSHTKQGNSLVKNDGMSPGKEGAYMLSEEVPVRNEVIDGIPLMPFAKISPVWQAVESLEVFQRFPQCPHFLPLMGEKEGVREGLAIAKMVTFASMVENVLKLSIDDPVDRFTDCLETLHSLKLNGFTAKSFENRVIKLLSLKEEQQKMELKKNEVQNQVSELIRENAGFTKAIHDIVNKIKVYEEQLATALLKRKERDGALLILRTSLEMLETVLIRTQLDFEELNHSW